MPGELRPAAAARQVDRSILRTWKNFTGRHSEILFRSSVNGLDTGLGMLEPTDRFWPLAALHQGPLWVESGHS